MMNKSIFLVIITLITALGGFLFGYDTGVINGTQFYFSKFFELSAGTKGFIVSSALLGALGGALTSGRLSDKIGRKNSLIISAILFTISAWGSGMPYPLPQEVTLLAVFRIIGGIAIGIASMNAPLYIAEIAPPNRRGRMVTYYQLSIVIGFFTVFLVTFFIGGDMGEIDNITRGWRYMFWSEIIPSILFLIFLFFVPKSPRWMIMKGKTEKALQLLTKIRGVDEAIVQSEFREMEQSLQIEAKENKVSIFSSKYFRIIMIGCILALLQQLTGINAVLYYGADIFEKALGFTGEDVLMQQILLAAVNLIFTFVAFYLVDRLGRKPLLYVGIIGMIIGFLMIGLSLYLSDYNNLNTLGEPSISNFEAIICLMGILVFIASFAMSMGPVTWVLIAEIFPNKIKSTAMSLAVAIMWLTNYLVSQFFPIIAESDVNALQKYGGTFNNALPYFVFLAFLGFSFIFIWKYVPETKGKTLEEMNNLW